MSITRLIVEYIFILNLFEDTNIANIFYKSSQIYESLTNTKILCHILFGMEGHLCFTITYSTTNEFWLTD